MFNKKGRNKNGKKENGNKNNHADYSGGNVP